MCLNCTLSGSIFYHQSHDNIDASDNANPENVTELITAEESATSAHGSFSHTPNFEHMLCVPIIDAHGKVVGVIQALNKKGVMKNIVGKTSGQEGFTAIDSWKLQSMAMQLSLAMMEHSKNMSNDD